MLTPFLISCLSFLDRIRDWRAGHTLSCYYLTTRCKYKQSSQSRPSSSFSDRSTFDRNAKHTWAYRFRPIFLKQHSTRPLAFVRSQKKTCHLLVYIFAVCPIGRYSGCIYIFSRPVVTFTRRQKTLSKKFAKFVCLAQHAEK